MTEERRVQLVAEVDTTRTRAGFQEIGQQAGQMAQQVTQAGERAERAVSGVGAGATTSSRNVDTASRSIIGSIQRTTAAMESGGRATAAYYEVLARQRGVDPSTLTPYLAQLRAVEQAQANAAHTAAEQQAAQSRAAEAARAAAVAQRELAQAQSTRDNFVASLQDQVNAIGRTRAELLELRAAQLGVSDHAAPLIARLREAESGLTRTGVSAAQTANALRQVPAQFTDIVTSLQGGQAPLTVLLQQGGQLRDTFGSTGAAARALGGYIVGLINPYTVAAAAAVALAVAYKTGAEEASGYARAIALTGNAAGTTVDQLSQAARQIGAISGSQGAAAEALNALVSTGQVSAENLQRFGAVAVDVQKVIGRSVADTAADFAELGRSPLAALEKISEKYHFITAATYAQVKALQDQGRAQEAADVAQKAYADGIDRQRQKVLDTLTDWERGWIRIKSAVSGAADAVIDFAGGRETGGFDKINGLLDERAKIEENLARARKRNLPADVAMYEAELDANKRAINVIRDKGKANKEAAKAESDAAQIAEARIKWQQEGDKYLGRAAQLERDVTRARTEGAAAHLSEAEIEKRVADIRKSYADIFNASIESNIAALKRRDQVADVLEQRELARIQAQRTLGSISEDDSINSTAKAELAAFDRKKGLLEAELVLTKRKANSVKEQSDLEGQIAVLGEQRRNRELQQQNDLLVAQQKRALVSEQLFNKGAISATAERDSIIGQVEAQFQANQEIGLGVKQVAELQSARLYNAAALKEQTAAELDSLEPGNALAKTYREQAQALRDLGDAKVRGAVKQEIYEKPLQDLNAMVDILSALDQAAQSAAQGMAQSFGTVGQAIGGMTTALTGYERTQAAIAAQLAGSIKDAHGDPTKIQRANQMAAEASAQAQIKSYGDMGAAAKGFFKENTAGYRAMEGVEKTFRAFEMAMALSNMAQKLGLVGTYTTAVVAGKQVETQATLASVGPEVSAAMVKGQAAAVAGVAGQAQGDPYTAWPRMAAMAAVMVGLGFAVSGGSGSGISLSQQRQEVQGSGSVLGDSTAKSESIKRALEAVDKNTYQGLAINSSMLVTLRSIDNNISSFAGQLVRSTDITNPDVGSLNTSNGLGKSIASWGAGGVIFGSLLAKIPVLGNIFDKVGTSIFGGKQSVVDSGFGMDATALVNILSSGVHAFQYADIKTSGGWFGKDKTSEKSNALNDAANAQFTSIIKSMADGVKSAGELLGLSGDDFTAKLNSFVVDIGHVSLKDLKGDDLQKALESVFSKLGDDMAQYAVGGLRDLQQVGEGYLETLTRIAGEYQTIDVVFQSFGKTFGEVGLASVGARDRLVQLAGGLDKFTSQGEYFLTNFFNEKEQAASLKARIDPTLAQYGLSTAGEDATKMFRDFIVCLDTTTEAGAKAYTELMGIAPAFKAVTDAQKAAQDERKDLQGQLDELTMSSTQLLAKQRDALDESNRALFDQVQAIKSVKDSATAMLAGVNDAFSVLQKVTAREKSAIQSSVEAHTAAFGKLQSLSQALHSTLDSLKSPDQKAFERAAGQAQIRAALAIAKAGGPLPDSEKLKGALGAVTQDASGQFGSFTDYMRDLLQTQNDVAQLAGLTDDSLSVEQKSLDALSQQIKRLDDIVTNGQAQIDALNGQSVATLSIAQALEAFKSSISTAQTNPIVGGTSTIAGFYQDLLGRAPDQAGLKYWQDALAQGSSLDNIRAALMGSDEYKRLHPFAVGTNFVPETMPALVHQGERIIPAADNRVLMSVLARSGSGDSAALVAEVKALRETVAMQQAALDRIANNTKEHKDMFEQSSGGGGPLLVEIA